MASQRKMIRSGMSQKRSQLRTTAPTCPTPSTTITFADQPTWRKEFPVIGKDTFTFNITRSTPFLIRVTDKPSDAATGSTSSSIDLKVESNKVTFIDSVYGVNKNNKSISDDTFDSEIFDTVGVEEGFTCSYWLSYDRDRMVIKYGKGYRMKRTTILEHNYYNTIEDTDLAEIQEGLFNEFSDRFVEFYDQAPEMLSSSHSMASVEEQVKFDSEPLVDDLPYLVRNSNEANLFDLDTGKFLYSASLPPECQTMFDNVCGPDVDINFQGTDSNNQYSFKLPDAIRYSIETEGCALYNRLRYKETEFGDDPNMTYLRVTLGKDYGQSPGIPYVLELWPKGNYSPIHNHGNAYAVIRVLHGGLTVKYFNKVSVKESDVDGEQGEAGKDHQIGQFDAKAGNATWLASNWYQTHQLKNDTDEYCATIQCYMYGTNDHVHWPHFDYIKNTTSIDEFTPDSDFSFTEMFNTVMTEYANRHQPK